MKLTKTYKLHHKSGEYVADVKITIDIDDGTDDLVLEEKQDG